MPTVPHTYQARVIDAGDVAADTRIIKAMLDHGQRLPFLAGQYAMLRLPGADPRPFSIASAPGAENIEFHIRSLGHGFSAQAVESLLPGASFAIEAPFGDAYWRPSDRAILLLAGGMGMTPMKSIIEHHLQTDPSRPVHLYWGARQQGQLYLDSHFRGLAQRHASFSYIPLTEDGSGGLRQGLIAPALKEDFDSLHGLDIYLSGPPAMTAALLPQLLQSGAEKDRLFGDRIG